MVRRWSGRTECVDHSKTCIFSRGCTRSNYYERGRIDGACDELRKGLEKAYAGPDRTVLPPQYLTLLARPYVRLAHTLHRDGETVAVLEGLASSFPADGALEELIGVVYRDGLHRADEAARHFERARRLGAR